jgi:hypothetical protein
MIAVQVSQVCHESRTDGIQVDIPYKFAEVGILFANNGLVAVLKEVAVPFVAPIKCDGIAREQAPHETWQPGGPTSNKQMSMVRKNNPSVDRRSRGRCYLPKSPDKRFTVPRVLDNLPSFHSTDDHMM